MLQRGVETQDMDVRWVSSLSWYFLNFFGLNGLYRMILGNNNCGCGLSLSVHLSHFLLPTAAQDTRDLAANPFAAATPVGPQPGQDYHKMFTAEIDNLELAEGSYEWSAKDVELRILSKFGKVPSQK